jgi:hypothetical protein
LRRKRRKAVPPVPPLPCSSNKERKKIKRGPSMIESKFSKERLIV